MDKIKCFLISDNDSKEFVKRLNDSLASVPADMLIDVKYQYVSTSISNRTLSALVLYKEPAQGSYKIN